MAITRFSNQMERAARLDLTLHPYQAADGRPFVAVCKNAVQLADVEEKRLRHWLTAYAEQQVLNSPRRRSVSAVVPARPLWQRQ